MKEETQEIETPEIETPAKETALPKLVKGMQTHATMKATIAKGKIAVIFDGRIITDPKDLPSDAEIDAHRKEVAARGKLK